MISGTCGGCEIFFAALLAHLRPPPHVAAMLMFALAALAALVVADLTQVGRARRET